MQLASRQSLWPKQKETPLPDWDYPVEYLRSTGKQYLDLYPNIIVGNNDYLRLEWEPLDTLSLDKHYHGISYNGGIAIYRSCYRPSGYATQAFQCYEGTIQPGYTWPPAVLINNNVRTIFTIDSTHTTIWSKTNNYLMGDYPLITTATTRHFYLFWMENNPMNKGSCKVWNFQYISNDRTYNVYLQPCVKDGIACMADLISRQFIYNAGLNDFYTGPEVTEQYVINRFKSDWKIDN